MSSLLLVIKQVALIGINFHLVIREPLKQFNGFMLEFGLNQQMPDNSNCRNSYPVLMQTHASNITSLKVVCVYFQVFQVYSNVSNSDGCLRWNMDGVSEQNKEEVHHSCNEKELF